MTENSKKPIPVLVSGALGRMGSEVVNTVLNSTDCELVAAIDINEKNNGSNISELLKVKNSDIKNCVYPMRYRFHLGIHFRMCCR